MLVGAREEDLENGFRLRQSICCSVSSGKQLKVKRTSADADYNMKLSRINSHNAEFIFKYLLFVFCSVSQIVQITVDT